MGPIVRRDVMIGKAAARARGIRGRGAADGLTLAVRVNMTTSNESEAVTQTAVI